MSDLDGVRVGVLTVSDRVAAGARDDAGGSALCELLQAAGAVLVSRAVVPDERELISAAAAETRRPLSGPTSSRSSS